MAKCTFCGDNIQPGSGLMFVLNTGDSRYYCSRKCEKNQTKLKRDPKNIKWTEASRKARGK